MTGATVVVGATGVLRPLVAALAARGDTVVAVARDPSGAVDAGDDGATSVVACPADGRTAAGAEAVVAAAWAADASAAVVYSPAAGPDLLAGLAGVVDRLVLVLPSAAAAPADDRAGDAPWSLDDLPRPPHGAVPLVLGWRAEGGGARWHAPGEVSAAALEVLDSGRPALLGRVRPWSDHP